MTPEEELKAPHACEPKLNPDVLLDIPADVLAKLSKVAYHTYQDIFRRIKTSNNLFNAAHMELVLALLIMRLIKNCHLAVLDNSVEKPRLAEMVDRFQVMLNQMEEIYIHGREIQIKENPSDGGHPNVVHFDPERIPQGIREAYQAVGVTDLGLRLPDVAEDPGTGRPAEDEPLQPH